LELFAFSLSILRTACPPQDFKIHWTEAKTSGDKVSACITDDLA